MPQVFIIVVGGSSLLLQKVFPFLGWLLILIYLCVWCPQKPEDGIRSSGASELWAAGVDAENPI